MALGNNTFTAAGAAVADLYSAKGSRIKAQGDLAEAEAYGKAARLSRENVTLEEYATKIQQTQQEREANKVIGTQTSQVAGFGFEESGSGLDLLRSSAQQGALANQLIGEQGAIQANSFQQQADAYSAMQTAAEYAARVDENAAKGKGIAAIINGVAAIGSLF